MAFSLYSERNHVRSSKGAPRPEEYRSRTARRARAESSHTTAAVQTSWKRSKEASQAEEDVKLQTAPREFTEEQNAQRTATFTARTSGVDNKSAAAAECHTYQDDAHIHHGGNSVRREQTVLGVQDLVDDRSVDQHNERLRTVLEQSNKTPSTCTLLPHTKVRPIMLAPAINTPEFFVTPGTLNMPSPTEEPMVRAL